MRYLTPFIVKDLQKKMVFLSGPRQVGKTYLANTILHEQAHDHGVYFNWDFDKDKSNILSLKWLEQEKLIILDEIHKYKRWKNWLKGIFDKYRDKHQFLITGSARLDTYRRGGDSLMGRYHSWRLHPFSLEEHPAKLNKKEVFGRLMTVGGFHEPLLDRNEIEARRWRKERYEKILRNDVRDLEPIKDIQYLALLLDLLRKRVGSAVVIANIAENLHVSFNAVKNWVDILERMYVVFKVKPYTNNLARAILKPPKIYFFDNADIMGDEGARFENLVATHLLKKLNYIEDRFGYKMELNYIRDKEGREVDFVVLKDGNVEDLIEVKWGDDEVSKSLQYYAEKLNPKNAVQIVGQLKKSYSKNKLHVISPFEYFKEFPINA